MKLNRWLVVFLYTLLIFATIPYVPRIWGVFTEPLGKNISAVLNVIYFVAACCIVLYSYLKLKKKSLIFYTALSLIFLCYGYLLKDLHIPIEKIHLLEYGLLSFLIYWVIEPDGDKVLIYGFILGMVFLVGLADELVQKLTPGRVCEFRDVLLNWKAGTLGFLLVLTFKKR